MKPMKSLGVVLVVLTIGLPILAQDEPAGTVKLTVEDGLYSLRAKDAALGDVLAKLQEATGVEIDMDPGLLKETVNLVLTDVPYEKIIEAVAGSHALIYERDADGNERLISARITSQMLLDQRDLTRSDRRDIKRKTKQVRKALKRLNDIYGYAGVLDYDEAKALIQQRKVQEQALIDDLAAMGPGGARAMQAVYAGAETGPGSVRGQLALVKALEKIDDPEAPLVLGAIYEEDERYSLQREVVAALGHRTDSLATIQEIIASEDDMRLLGPSMMALSNKPEALDTLSEMIQEEDGNRDVRQEAIRSVGEIGGEEGQAVLTDIASDESAHVSVRVSAVGELWRTYGEEARPTLEALSQDSNEKVRNTAAKMLGRLDGAGQTAAADTP